MVKWDIREVVAYPVDPKANREWVFPAAQKADREWVVHLVAHEAN